MYVTGASTGDTGSFDYATIKYDTAGNQLWVSRYDGPAHGSDWPTAIAVDDVGRVDVTGNSEGIGTGADYGTIQYSPEGATNWVDRYDGPGHLDDYAWALAVDANGNVYVTGQSFDPVTGSDYVTVLFANGS